MAIEIEPVTADAVAPNAAKLLRAIAEAKHITKHHPTRIAELAKIEDLTQVTRWWKGKRRIGDENRDRLVAAFPEFEAAIDSAIQDDWKLRRRRRKKKAVSFSASALISDPSAPPAPEMAAVLANMPDDQQRELAAIAREMLDLGWSEPADDVRDALGLTRKRIERRRASARKAQ